MRARLVLGLPLVLALGCGGVKFAPVSGKVTLDGRRLLNPGSVGQPISMSTPNQT